MIKSDLTLIDVLLVPSFACNLISVHKLASDSTCMIIFFFNGCLIQDLTLKKQIGMGNLANGVYYLEGIASSCNLVTTQRNE